MPPSPAVSIGPAIADNLKTLGKMQRGDMLAKADTSGRLVRKTNWLTQKHNSSRTHDADLFAEIKAVLTAAESKIENDQNPENEFTTLYVNAIKGLETLLQTYRSKGSKETDLIDQLTLVLVEHVANIEKNTTGPQGVNSLMAVAKQTIKYVQDCRIRSTNNNFLKSGGIGWDYYDKTWDCYLLVLLVRGSSGVKVGNDKTLRDLKTLLIDISRRPISRNEKRRILAAALNSWFGSDGGLQHLRTIRYGTNYKDFQTEWTERNVPKGSWLREKERHKLARRALRTRFGNCGEKTAVTATHLVEATRGAIGICRVGGKEYDHDWVLISRQKKELIQGCEQLAENGRGKQLLPRDTVVVDGWTKDWWGLRDWFNPLGNTRQLAVRQSIRKEIANNGLFIHEFVRWPPAPENSYFRLRYAHLTQMNPDLLGPDFTWAKYQDAVNKLKQYRATLSQVLSQNTLHQLIDHPDIDSVEEIMSEQSRMTQQIEQELASYGRQHRSQRSQAGHASFTGRNSLMPSEQSSVAAHHSSFRSES